MIFGSPYSGCTLIELGSRARLRHPSLTARHPVHRRPVPPLLKRRRADSYATARNLEIQTRRWMKKENESSGSHTISRAGTVQQAGCQLLRNRWLSFDCFRLFSVSVLSRLQIFSLKRHKSTCLAQLSYDPLCRRLSPFAVQVRKEMTRSERLAAVVLRRVPRRAAHLKVL